MEGAFILGWAGAVLITLVIYYFINDFFNKVHLRVNIMKAQLHLLSKIAEKQGVDPEEIYKAINHSQGHKTLD